MSSVNSKQGRRLLCGMDEAGRGALAGPLVAAAVIFPRDFSFTETFPGLAFRDSKKLSKGQRETLIKFIHEYALSVHTEIVEVPDIDAQGIGWANRVVFERLIMAIDADRYVVDGNLKLANLGRKARRVVSVVRADETIEAVTAASIIAKVTRDRLMQTYHAAFPCYGWDHNAGYGTAMHIDALREHGACIQHRRQFVSTALSKDSTPLLPGFGD